MKNRIFVVEDDSSIRDMYEMAFDSQEFEVTSFVCAEDMLETLGKSKCDLVLMDLMLPGMDGMEAIQKLKANIIYRDIPVIIVSAKGDEDNKVKGLDIGADDYLAKPFGMHELVARVKANLRKSKINSINEQALEYGEISINDKEHIVAVKGNVVALTLKEYNLLKLLMENTDNVVLRDDILAKVWDYDYFGETRTLDMHIKSLRSKLAVFTDKQYIHTVRGVGYKFSMIC